MKLDIGCGKDKLEGYVGVDLYEESADIKDDITTLYRFSDNSIEEVRAFHLLEHLFEKDIKKSLESIFRVLKPRGRAVIEVPDLIWLFKDFLGLEDSQRWGWKIQTIFGLQREHNAIGELHKTGFSIERLERLLKDVGFIDIKVVSSFSEKYNQGVLDAEATKP